MEDSFANPKKHKFLADHNGCQFCGFSEKHHKLNEVIDPRGPGSVDRLEQLREMEGGQPNIIDYSNQEPLLFGAGENSSHDYPGKIVVNNEPERALHVNDFEVKKATIPGPAATGIGSTGHNTTQPTLPNGAPIEIRDHPGHGDNFNDKIKWNETKIELMKEKVDEYSNNVDKFEIDVDKLADSAKVELEEELLYHQIKATTPHSEGIEIKDESQEDNSIKPEEKLLYKQIIASTAGHKVSQTTNPHSSLMHIEGEKSDTGDDLSRTGPEGLRPRENNDATHYEGQSDTKLNVATGIEITPEITKQLYNVDGTIPELREAIEIKVNGMIEAVDDKEPFLRKIFPFLKKAGIVSLTLIGFLKLMEEQNYQQIDMFKTKTIDDLVDKIPKLKVKKFKKFKYNSGKIECPICKPLDGMEFAEDDSTRPIVPSENLGVGVYNTHSHCKCTNKDFEKLIPIETEPKSDPAQSRAAASSLRERKDITAEYLRPLSESLNIYKDRQHGEFDWIDDDAIDEMIKYAHNHGSGKFILGVLSGETITDHRIEGTEKYRRRWSNNELIQNIRTAKGKMIDINHLYPKIDMQSGGVYDSNWNFTTSRGEVIIWETDRDILEAIRNDVIGAISIHTGLPRKINENCDDGECFLEPSGTILGEQDNIALAYVVTGADGFSYNGQVIPSMPPGMQFTRLYLVE